MRALAASERSYEHISDARLIKRKLTPKPVVIESANTGTTGEEKSTKITVTSSRLDFDGLADTFATLVELVRGIRAYAPNETELKVAALEQRLKSLHANTKAVHTAANALANARIQRNKLMLGKEGVFETGTAVKEYIRSVFGVRSEVYRELGKLRLAA